MSKPSPLKPPRSDRDARTNPKTLEYYIPRFVPTLASVIQRLGIPRRQ